MKFWREKFKGETSAEKYGWTFVFDKLVPKEINEQIDQAVAGHPWWLPVEKAFFLQPEGPGTTIDERLDHPVKTKSFFLSTFFLSLKNSTSSQNIRGIPSNSPPFFSAKRKKF